MTECASCGLAFAGTSAFDFHRRGVHAFTLSEGLRMEQRREDGRRCLHVSEMGEAGMELDSRGRWRVKASPKQLAGLARMRAGAPTNALEATEGLRGTAGRAAA